MLVEANDLRRHRTNMGSPKKAQSLVTHTNYVHPITTGHTVLAKSPCG
jgi:hypothetical protein